MFAWNTETATQPRAGPRACYTWAVTPKHHGEAGSTSSRRVGRLSAAASVQPALRQLTLRQLALRQSMLALLVLGLSALGLGCGPQAGTDVGNGLSVTMELHGYEAAAKGYSRTLSNGTRLDSVHLVIDSMRLVPGSDCEGEDDDEQDYEMPLVADLLDGGVIGPAPTFSVVGNTFCRFRMGRQKLDAESAPAGAPPELIGLSLRVTGARADDVPFIVESEDSDAFELAAKDGSFTLSSTNTPLITGYELRSWITALDLDSLSGSPIVINKTSNTERLAAFDERVEESARLFRDLDGDSNLDPDETSAGSSLTE